MKNFRFALASIGFVLLAAGCGGGGSSSNSSSIPTASVQITATNAQMVAKGAMTPAQSAVKGAGSTASIVGVVTQNFSRHRSLMDISLAEFNRARGLKLTPTVAGAINSIVVSCTTSGNYIFSFQDNNNNGQFDVGDVLTMTFYNCVEPASAAGNGTTMNGGMSFAITSASGTLVLGGATGTPLSPFNTGFTLTFSNLSTVDNVTGQSDSTNGDINFTTSDDGTNTTVTMSGTSLSTSDSVNGAFSMTNYSFNSTDADIPTASTSYSYSVAMTTASVLAGGSVTITTPTPFAGVGYGNPTSGQMVLTGANSSTLTLTANPDGIHVGIVVDDDGAAGPHAPVTITDPTTSSDYTWADI